MNLPPAPVSRRALVSAVFRSFCSLYEIVTGIDIECLSISATSYEWLSKEVLTSMQASVLKIRLFFIVHQLNKLHLFFLCYGLNFSNKVLCCRLFLWHNRDLSFVWWTIFGCMSLLSAFETNSLLHEIASFFYCQLVDIYFIIILLFLGSQYPSFILLPGILESVLFGNNLGHSIIGVKLNCLGNPSFNRL